MKWREMIGIGKRNGRNETHPELVQHVKDGESVLYVRTDLGNRFVVGNVRIGDELKSQEATVGVGDYIFGAIANGAAIPQSRVLGMHHRAWTSQDTAARATPTEMMQAELIILPEGASRPLILQYHQIRDWYKWEH